MGKVQSRSSRRRVRPSQHTMREDRNERKGASSPEIDVGTELRIAVETSSTSQPDPVLNSREVPPSGASLVGPRDSPSLSSANYPLAPTPYPSSYYQGYSDATSLATNYGYSMYPPGWVYPGMALPTTTPVTHLTIGRENEPDWRGASANTVSSTKIWKPYVDDVKQEEDTTPRKRRAEEWSPRCRDVSLTEGMPRADPSPNRSWLDNVRKYRCSEPDNTVWLDTTILSSACKVREPYDDDHVIHLMAAQRVRVGPWRTRSVRTDIYFCFPKRMYGEIRPSLRAMQHHPSLVVEIQRVPVIPPDGVMVTIHNASNDTLTLRPGDEIAELTVLQALIPRFVLHYAKKDRARTPTCRSRPRDGEDSTDV